MLLSLQASQSKLFFSHAQSLTSLERQVRLDQNIPRWWRSSMLNWLVLARENFKPTEAIWNTAHFNLSYNFIFSGLDDVLLSGFRALSEQQPIAEDYSSFKWVLTVTWFSCDVIVFQNYLLSFPLRF